MKGRKESSKRGKKKKIRKIMKKMEGRPEAECRKE